MEYEQRRIGTSAPMRTRLMRRNLDVATGAGYHHFTPSTAAAEGYRTICFDPERHRNAFDYLGSYRDELPVLEQRLPSIAVPVLITWGAHDTFVRPTNAQRLHASLGFHVSVKISAKQPRRDGFGELRVAGLRQRF